MAARLVGCGSADITGEVWDAGMMGYGQRSQRTRGIHLRQRSRAFALGSSGRTVVLVVAEIGMFFANVRAAVLARLVPYGLDPADLLLTATHTHAGPGGCSCYPLYGTTNGGLRRHTHDALVDGVVASVEAALADLAPGELVLSRGELLGASVNRSPQAFALNPAVDRAAFPDGVDPSATVLRLERDGRLVGAVHWFATHGTSLSNRNPLLSGDNKGWAARTTEDRLDGAVIAFAQTNAGDVSPNVPDARGGPTADEYANTAVIGELQRDSLLSLLVGGQRVAGGLDTRLSYVNLPRLAVDGAFTPDGLPHRTGAAVLGAAFAAGTKEGPGVPFCAEGVERNRLLGGVSRGLYAVRPGLRDAQSPKAMFLPVGAARAVAGRLPVQLVRIGPLVLVALAQEVTVVAGLRLRRLVASRLGVPLEDVLVQGYANDYAGYVTTPEEYDEQRYEGGHTMFGRWTLPAYLQEVARVCDDLIAGRASSSLGPPVLGPVRVSTAVDPDLGVAVRGVRRDVAASYVPGDLVLAELASDDPRGRARPCYLLVERLLDSWAAVADDASTSTTVQWRQAPDDWVVTLTWRIPAAAAPGSYRLCYVDRAGEAHPTSPFLLVEGDSPP